jgi:hypothetical protein
LIGIESFAVVASCYVLVALLHETIIYYILGWNCQIGPSISNFAIIFVEVMEPFFFLGAFNV